MINDVPGNIGFTGDVEFNELQKRIGTKRYRPDISEHQGVMVEDDNGQFVDYSVFCAAIRTKVSTIHGYNRMHKELRELRGAIGIDETADHNDALETIRRIRGSENTLDVRCQELESKLNNAERGWAAASQSVLALESRLDAELGVSRSLARSLQTAESRLDSIAALATPRVEAIHGCNCKSCQRWREILSLCAHSSTAEHDASNVGAAGSSPAERSNTDIQNPTVSSTDNIRSHFSDEERSTMREVADKLRAGMASAVERLESKS